MYQRSRHNWTKHLDFYILDLIGVQAAFILAYFTRHGIHNLYRNELYMNSAFVLLIGSAVLPLFLSTFQNILRRGLLQELKSVLITVTSLSLLLLVYLFFTKTGDEFARSVVAFFALYGILVLWAVRVIWKAWILHRGVPDQKQRSILVVAPMEFFGRVIGRIREHSFGHMRISGVIPMDVVLPVGSSIEGYEVVCKLDGLIDYVQTKWIDEVFFAVTPEMPVPDDILDQLYMMGITTHRTVALRNGRDANRSIEEVGGYTCITESIRFATTTQVILKRMMDIIGGTIGLVFTGILLLFVGPAICFSDPGPVFFAQERVGRNGRIFRMYNVFAELFPLALCNKVPNIAF